MSWLSFTKSNGNASPSISNSAQQDLKVHYIMGPSHKRKNLQSIYSKATQKDHRFENDICKTALMGTLSFYSAI